jgi:hypothetical protein
MNYNACTDKGYRYKLKDNFKIALKDIWCEVLGGVQVSADRV